MLKNRLFSTFEVFWSAAVPLGAAVNFFLQFESKKVKISGSKSVNFGNSSSYSM